MRTLTALADPTRFRIVEMLAAQGALSAGRISQQFNISAPAISQHLKVLREAELVRVEARAQMRFYLLNPKGLAEIERWAETMKMLWEARFGALETVLAQDVKKSIRPTPKRSRAHDPEKL